MKYKTQMEAARNGAVTKELAQVASDEGIAEHELLPLVASGQVVIPANILHKSLHPYGIGRGLRTKINVNLGVSGDCADYRLEMEKVQLAEKFGTEAIMDLSNYGKTREFRRKLIELSPAMIGTVPIYDAIGYLEKDLKDITANDFLKVVRSHAKEGVDFMTIHAGINHRVVDVLMREKRQMNIVSRGGSLLFAWMKMTGNENPFYEHYEELLDILREYDVTISLGDALRPGSIADSTDASQIAELTEIGNLTKCTWEHDVQVLVEGPGHMAIDEIAANVKLEKKLCHGAPFYVLGPLVTDIAPGYDHITSAIGGAIAAANGADFLCYVTPAEHLRLPDLNDVKEGIIASKIAAHAADIAKGVKGARKADYRISEARGKLDWEETFRLSLDCEKAKSYYESVPPEDRHSCSMCGKMCAVRTMNKILDGIDIELSEEKTTSRG
ncbi:MAG: phosphomethylpyrimidine synthase ThiC [Tepidanaerobacter acetatoxydans]|uniref:phosphomethylpyrimidine synthase ThiC n=1 Tax=Tepidanaerobacter acetatoxydans TaxID=499229 RepID=UPI0026F002DE|nr:phosphomethylpyrimidine synthase ThiC [Tepidanaerobacter acetatoxydans]NLU11491.1 phosphomethylpyrimidine synthase ThiC [Tepidanaerobacter acetatoxydans]